MSKNNLLVGKLFALFYLLFTSISNFLECYLALPIAHYILRKHLRLQFNNVGLEEEDEEEDEGGICISAQARAANDKVAMMEFPPGGTVGDALRAHCLLYERTLAQCPLYLHLRGIRLLEVGSNHAGGLLWLQRAHPELGFPLTGVSPSCHFEANELTCAAKLNATTTTMKIQIVECENEADFLPLPEACQDIVLCVEGGHLCELRAKQFFGEVSRVLRSRGYLCVADISSKKENQGMKEAAEDAGFRLISSEELNGQMIRGMFLTSKRFEQLLEELPRWCKPLKNFLRENFVPDYFELFEDLQKGELIGALYCWQKTG